ncbi:hypothetical protein A6M21_01385 [Desulfotomaculum copahuensis]|uniref:Flagellar hook-length control protein-like C-terminal domain-containing protein n=1 Tax=Desulfotomaculum copahuensis TaxID=1838280 RepID=A0A1B7LB17_9FIRM|nr:hypothetical protein A6M21_01385 [Desulfotomaculum copahuensis]
MLEVNGAQATVRLAGQLFQATGELPPAGQSFWAVVESVKPDVLQLRKLDGPPVKPPAPAILVRLLDLPPGPDGPKLLGELLKWQLPLDRHLLLGLLSAGKNLTAAEKAVYWPVRAWLETLDIHADAAKVHQAINYLLGNDSATPKGQEVLNQAQPLFPGQEAVSFFTFQGANFNGELYIVDDRDGKKQAQKFPSGLVVRVHSPALGETWVHLVHNDGTLTARVAVAEERFVHPVQQAAHNLRTKLTALGYRVGEIQVTARPVHSICELLRPDLEPTYQPLNTTV